jgi:PAS domain S-box-containing protein
VGSFHWDVVANIVAWSDELFRVYGFEPGESSITYETYLDRVHQDDRDQVRQAVERSFANQEPFDHEYRIVRATGETRWVFAHGRPVVDSGGKLVALQGTCQDITERKRTSESLHDSEVRNRAMLEAIPDMMFLLSRDGVYLDFHVQDPSVLLVPPEQFLGKNIREVMPRELAEQFAKCFEDVTRSGQAGLVEYSHPILGEERHYEARVVNCDGSRVLSLVRDITEHKQVEQALRAREEQEREQRLRLALNASGAGCWMRDFRTDRVDRDDRFREIYGFEAGEPVSFEAWMSRVHEEDRRQVLELWEQIVHTKTHNTFDITFRIVRPDGTVSWIQSLGQVHRDAETINGSPELNWISPNAAVLRRLSRRAGTRNDRTLHKRAEEALRQSHAELERRTLQLRRLASDLTLAEQHVREDWKTLMTSAAVIVQRGVTLRGPSPLSHPSRCS